MMKKTMTKKINLNTKYIHFTLINLDRPQYKNSLVTTINHKKNFVLCKCGNEPSGSMRWGESLH
jgi:hypothetical protein